MLPSRVRFFQSDFIFFCFLCKQFTLHVQFFLKPHSFVLNGLYHFSGDYNIAVVVVVECFILVCTGRECVRVDDLLPLEFSDSRSPPVCYA